MGSLSDTVPIDKVVVLQSGWGLFRKRSSGEILLRLTYKAYVEDEEDDKTLQSVYTDVSDDEFYSEESHASNRQREEVSASETDESFMDVLAALIVSEEFQGIVASETENRKLQDEALSRETASTAFDAKTLNPSSDNTNDSKGTFCEYE